MGGENQLPERGTFGKDDATTLFKDLEDYVEKSDTSSNE